MTEDQKNEVEDEISIHGDILETLFSYLPLIHLFPACFVSKSWNAAVFSSLHRHNNKPKPWLLVHAQSIHRPQYAAVLAYDPRSNIWLRINQNPPRNHLSSPLRSSNSTLLYVLTPSEFSFSIDPFHLTWQHVNPPLVWRVDPVVSLIGHRIIVAGGACELEEDPLAVEIYDIKNHTWQRTNSMPATLTYSASATWLSVTGSTETIFMMEKITGLTHTFNLDSKMWYGPYDLRPDRNIYFSVIVFNSDSLIMFGLVGDSEDLHDIKVWDITGMSFEFCNEIGVMPKECVNKLKGEGVSLSSIRVSSIGGFFYVYNPGEPAELVVLEVGEERRCRWGSLRNAAVDDRRRVAERVVLTCSDVGLVDIGRAVAAGNEIITLNKC